MTIEKVIRARRSVRTFDGSALRPEDGEKIMAFAGEAENPYAIPISWRLLDPKKEDLHSPVITGESAYLAGKLKKVPHGEEAFGYSFERLLLYAWSLGVGSTWIAGTMDRPAFERAMALEKDEVMPCVTPLGYAAKRMSLRETMMRKGIKADTRQDFASLVFREEFGKAMLPEEAGPLRLPLELVLLAPSAVNKQPWRMVVCGNTVHFYEKRSKGYVSDGWDIQKIDMGIALCHFALASEEAGLHPVFFLADPGLPTDADTAYIGSYRVEG